MTRFVARKKKRRKVLFVYIKFEVPMVSADEKMMQDRAETGDTGTIFEMESTGETPQKVKLVDPERGASQTLENPSSLVE